MGLIRRLAATCTEGPTTHDASHHIHTLSSSSKFLVFWGGICQLSPCILLEVDKDSWFLKCNYISGLCHVIFSRLVCRHSAPHLTGSMAQYTPKIRILILTPRSGPARPSQPPSIWAPKSHSAITLVFLRGKDLKSRNIGVTSGRKPSSPVRFAWWRRTGDGSFMTGGGGRAQADNHQREVLEAQRGGLWRSAGTKWLILCFFFFCVYRRG